MSVTIGGLTISNLTAQPLSYEGTDVRAGLAARKWEVSGLLNTTQLASFSGIWETWLGNRQDDGDDLTDGVGSTVALSFSANGLTASGVACYFTEAPQYQQVGAYVQLTTTLIDANQALNIQKLELEKSVAAYDALKPDLGTITLGSVVITLDENAETLSDMPTLERTAGGFPYIKGPLRSSAVRNISGTVVNEAAFTTLRNWVATTVQSTPSANDWYPTSAPTASVESKMVNGVITEEWKVSLTVEQV